jgi:hypothetical protein
MSSANPPTPDGNPWTVDHVSSNGATADVPSSRPAGAPSRLVVLGYITAVALPLLGLIVGVVVATRPNRATSKHGTWIIGLSIVGSIVWALVFASGVLTSTTNDMGY